MPPEEPQSSAMQLFTLFPIVLIPAGAAALAFGQPQGIANRDDEPATPTSVRSSWALLLANEYIFHRTGDPLTITLSLASNPT